MNRPSRWIMGLMTAALVGACDANPTARTAPDANGNPTLQGPDGKPLALPKLSEHDAVGWSDLAIGADGTLHAVFTDRPAGAASAVYYRASSDGGATWSAPKNLMDADRLRHAGVPQIAVDGQGRVYALWKSMASGSSEDSLKGGAYGAPLMGRVLEAGRWSEPFTVEKSKQVRSWFASVAPDGRLHVVWAENVQAPNGYQTINAAVIRQARLDGPAATGAQTLLAAQPTNEPGYDGSAWYYPHYEGLRGYVDAQGLAHWTATKHEPRADYDAAMLVHWDGRAETPMFKFFAYATDTGPYNNPAELLRDDLGREHVLVQDARGERKGVLDFTVGGSKEPVVVRQALDVTGSIKAFQAVQGADGRLGAMLSLKDASAAEQDLWVTTYQAGQWGRAVNVTNNEARGTYKEFKNDSQVSTRYEPNFTSGAFDAQGKLNMVVVNMELVTLSMTTVGSVNGELVGVRDGGVMGNPIAFFLKL